MPSLVLIAMVKAWFEVIDTEILETNRALEHFYAGLLDAAGVADVSRRLLPRNVRFSLRHGHGGNLVS
jgi:hypothetical protein